MEVSAAMVMDLRKMTGLSMMECKKALIEASGNTDKAIALLRERGLKKVAERAGNMTPNGKIFMHRDGTNVAMLGLGCETEPVTATDDFKNLGNTAAQLAAKMSDPTVDSLKEVTTGGRKLNDLLDDVLNRIREKIILTDVATYTGQVGTYIHHNGMVGVLIEFNQPCPDQMKADVCMHVAAMNPRCLKREEVSADDVTIERERFMKEVTGKPANIVENIVNGKLNSWFKEFVLLEQPFVKDDKKSVQQALSDAAKGLTITRFKRFRIGT